MKIGTREWSRGGASNMDGKAEEPSKRGDRVNLRYFQLPAIPAFPD